MITHGGFVAYASEGSFSVLSVIDMTHLGNKIVDAQTGATLGWTQEVKMTSKLADGSTKNYIVATL